MQAPHKILMFITTNIEECLPDGRTFGRTPVKDERLIAIMCKDLDEAKEKLKEIYKRIGEENESK